VFSKSTLAQIFWSSLFRLAFTLSCMLRESWLSSHLFMMLWHNSDVCARLRLLCIGCSHCLKPIKVYRNWTCFLAYYTNINDNCIKLMVFKIDFLQKQVDKSYKNNSIFKLGIYVPIFFIFIAWNLFLFFLETKLNLKFFS
jgi:hypothetical protein